MAFQVWGFSTEDGRLCFNSRTPRAAPAMQNRKDALDAARLLQFAALGLFDQVTEQFELLVFDPTHSTTIDVIWAMIQDAKDAAPGELTPTPEWRAKLAQLA